MCFTRSQLCNTLFLRPKLLQWRDAAEQTASNYTTMDLRSTPSQFLELPIKIRLMVYGLLAVTTRHVKLAIEGPNGGLIKLVIHEIAVQILAVSRQVNSEASAIMLPRLAQMTILPQLILSCNYNDHGELISWGGGRKGKDKIYDLALVAGSNPYYYMFGKDILYASKWVGKWVGGNEKRAVEQWVRVARRNMYFITGKLDNTYQSFWDIPLQFTVEDRDDLSVVADREQWRLAAGMFFRGHCSLGREFKVIGLARPTSVNGEGEVSGGSLMSF